MRMPLNFPANANNFPFFPGNSFDQLTAARDMLMVYPQAAALPVNRYWVQPLVGGEKK